MIYIIEEECKHTELKSKSKEWLAIIRYQSRDVIYPVLKGMGFAKR
jgi:hypothetical protein